MRPHLKILVVEDAADLLEQITTNISNTIDHLQALANQKLTVQGIYDGEIYVVEE